MVVPARVTVQFLSRLAAGNQADKFQLRQRRIRSELDANAVASAGDGEDNAVISNICFSLDIDDGINPEGVDKIDVSSGDLVSLALECDRPFAGFDMACERRTGPRPLDIQIDSARCNFREFVLDIDIAIACYVNGESKTIQSAASAIQPARPQPGEGGGLKTAPVGDAVEPQISVQRGFIGSAPQNESTCNRRAQAFRISKPDLIRINADIQSFHPAIPNQTGASKPNDS